MPRFKPKTEKHIKVDKKTIITVDTKHENVINDIINEENQLPILKSKMKKLKKVLSDLSSNDIIHQLSYEQQLQELKYRVKQIQQKRKSYYLDNSKYIFDYFENKKSIMENDNKKIVLNQFFKVNDLDKKVETKLNHNDYFSSLDPKFINMDDYIKAYDICASCNGDMTCIENEGVMVCTKCYRREMILIEHDKPSYKEPPKEVSFYAYKRINHFREIIAQFQAKESTHIKEEILENIRNQIKKERIKLSDLTNEKTKSILKNLGYNKYYEHISFIKEKLGIRPPRMSCELEQKLCNLFLEIQTPYSKHCPVERVNFLNYYYVLYKLCELLREDEYLPYFYMLKDQEKRNEQDDIWKKICHELNWEFIRTN
jgi:hypothetical protein